MEINWTESDEHDRRFYRHNKVLFIYEEHIRSLDIIIKTQSLAKTFTMFTDSLEKATTLVREIIGAFNDP